LSQSIKIIQSDEKTNKKKNWKGPNEGEPRKTLFSFKTFELKFNSGWKKITFTFNPKFCHFIVMEYTCKKVTSLRCMRRFFGKNATDQLSRHSLHALNHPMNIYKKRRMAKK
jgi:hypothetical protein